jgi:hypothetical protein
MRPDLFLQEAADLLDRVARGHVHDDTHRKSALALASHQLRLAEAALLRDESETEQYWLAQLRAKHAQLMSSAPIDVQELRTSLKDWTEPLRRPAHQVMPFDFERSLATAATDPGRSGAAFTPACEALAAGWPDAANRRSAALDLDRTLRLAAVHGDTFRVVATSIVAAVVGEGSVADGIIAALTTPTFRSVTDQGGLRIVYAALALLVHPRAQERDRAIEASDYLLRRERPGPDEIQFLSPAALQTRREPAGVLRLYAQWLDWDDQGSDHLDLAQIARNVCCSLDLTGFEPLDHALARISDEPSGEHLVRNLGHAGNDALLLVPVDSDGLHGSQCEASPRSRVAAITRNAKAGQADAPPVPVRVGVLSGSLAATALGQMREAAPSPYPRFTGRMRRRRGHVAAG